MESTLKFIKTWEVAQFKAQQEVDKLEVKRNPHTGKVFFVYGCECGPCSRKVEEGLLTDPVVSQVCNAGRNKGMLHILLVLFRAFRNHCLPRLPSTIFSVLREATST